MKTFSKEKLILEHYVKAAEEVMAVLDVEKAAAYKQCQRWLMHGFVERLKQGKFKKIIKDLMI